MKKENKKRRSIFNLFDLTLIVVVLILGSVIYFVSNRSVEDPAPSLIGSPTTPIRYTLQVSRIEEFMLDVFEEGKPIVETDKKYIIGTVQSVEIGPGISFVNDYENERQIFVEAPGRYNVMLEVLAEGDVGERNITVGGGYVIRVGKTVSCKMNGGVFQATVVAIERVEK